MASLTDIEGIGLQLAGKLKAAGVGSVEKLLERGGTPKGREELAAATGIDAARLARFVNHADLMRIRGIGGEYAELLEAAGVDTVPELAQRNAANLTQKLSDINQQKSLVRLLPAQSRVESWVEQAKELPRAITY